jgi:cell division protein FtsN
MPDKNKSETGKPLDEETGNNIDIFEHVREDKEPTGLEPTPEPSDKVTIIYGEQKDAGDKTSEEKISEKETKEGTLKDEKGMTDKEKETVLVKVPDKKKYDYPTTWIAKPEPTAGQVKPTPKPYITKKETKTKQITEYWIQAGSFKTKSKAESLNQKLIEHGFEGQIHTRELNGVTYYRVRIGPYTNKAEAEKFLSWIKVLDGMEDCYISQIKLKK